ncbi:selenocysteine lyase [Fusarium sp. NRRL 52700]|nr:selenocysteine lyase [Fusarium sp. NRRL 52700]
MPITTIHSLSEYSDLIQRHRFVILFATATWCAPCQRIKPFFEDDANASDYDTEKLVFAEFDTDEVPELDSHLQIRSVPEFFVTENAEQVDKLAGANPPALHLAVLTGMSCRSSLNMSQSQLDIKALRAKFPALQQDQVFLDNAGGSQILGAAADSIRDYLITSNVQMGASYSVGKLSATKVNKGYEAAARYINALPDEIVYGASSTQLLRNLALGLTFAHGDEIIVSTLDHEANIAPWLDLAERQGLNIKWWTPEGQGNNPKLTVESLKPLLTDRTRFLALTHCTNLLGSIHDVKAIAAAAHEYPNVLVCVDGVAFAPHRPIDVRDLGIDFYCLSWYKVFGPHIAMLYGSRDAQKQLHPLGHYFNPAESLSDKAGFSAGSYELIASISVVVDHLLAESWDKSIQQEMEIQKLLLDYLHKRDDATIYGEPSSDPSKRLPIVSFTIDGWNSRSVVAAIEANSNLGLKHGHFYSHRLVKEVLDLDTTDGVVRVSMAHYNTLEEIQAVIDTLQNIIVKR